MDKYLIAFFTLIAMGSGDRLIPYGMKLLPESILTYCEFNP